VHRGEGDPVIRVDTVYLHEAREPPRSGKAMLDLQSGEWWQGTPCACPFRNGVVL